MIFLRDERSLYVNLLVPSEVEWMHDGQIVRVRQETYYPEAETSRITLALDRPAQFALHFRVPSWSGGATMTINGEPVFAPGKPGDWATIERDGVGRCRRSPSQWRSVLCRSTSASQSFRDHVWPGSPGAGRSVLPQAALDRVDSNACRAPRQGGESIAIPAAEHPTRTAYALPPQPLYSIPGFWPYWVTSI